MVFNAIFSNISVISWRSVLLVEKNRIPGENQRPVGDLEDLNTNLCAFIRLENACDIGMITEVDLPTRFLFILLVPKGNLEPALETGRCMGTLITDEGHEPSYRS
jgi:hypothetical protein